MIALAGAYLDEAILLNPWKDCKAQPKCERIFECCQDCHGLAGERAITVNHICHADGRHSAENSVADPTSRNGNHVVQVFPQPSPPQQEADRAKSEG